MRASICVCALIRSGRTYSRRRCLRIRRSRSAKNTSFSATTKIVNNPATNGSTTTRSSFPHPRRTVGNSNTTDNPLIDGADTEDEAGPCVIPRAPVYAPRLQDRRFSRTPQSYRRPGVVARAATASAGAPLARYDPGGVAPVVGRCHRSSPRGSAPTPRR